jgi:hypothetical protein
MAVLFRSHANTLFRIPRSDSDSINGCKSCYGGQIITPTKEAIDVQSDAEDDGMTVDQAAGAGQKVINSMDLKVEAKTVVPSLQIWISAAKNNWQTPFSKMMQHQTTILDCMNLLAPILSKVRADVTKAIQTRQTRKETLNARFQTSISDYAERASKLMVVGARHTPRKPEVDALPAEPNAVVG